MHADNKMEIDNSESEISKKSSAREIPAADVLVLQGHQAEVFNCEWNPNQPLLATGYAQICVPFFLYSLATDFAQIWRRNGQNMEDLF